MELEKLATSKITEVIAGTNLLSPWISEGDKEPSWDGFIYAYSDKNHKKKDLIGRAPVQVKGKKMSNLKKKSITYPVSMVDLKNYRNEGGTIFFVVGITEKLEKKVYYASLVPFLLNQIIRISGNKKKPNISLIELPVASNEIENMTINFLREMRRQSVSRDKNWTIEEVTKTFGPENIALDFTFTCIGYDRNDPFSYLKNHELYMYAGNKDKSILFPIERIDHMHAIVMEKESVIAANGNEYYHSLKIEHTVEEEHILHFGKSFRFIIRADKSGSFKYALKGTVNQRVTDLRFLKDVVAQKGFYIDDGFVGLNITEKEIEDINIEDAMSHLKYLELVQELLDKLHVKKDLEFDNLTDKENGNLKMLINTILYGKTAGFKEKDIPPLASIDIANIKLMLLFNQKTDGRYFVDDYFGREVSCSVDKTPNTETSQYTIMKRNDFLYADNLHWDTVIESLKKYHNDSHYQQVVLCLLEMIKAYDQDRSKVELLDYAEELCDWLKEMEVGNPIHTINKAQCHYRRDGLSDEDLAILSDMVSASETTEMIKAGIHILLDNKRLAEMCIERLSETEKKDFVEYPIYNLLKQEEDRGTA